MRGTITLPEGTSYQIEHTPNGWRLVLQNAHCTLTQMFRSSLSAQQGVAAGIVTLDSLTQQHLQRHPKSA